MSGDYWLGVATIPALAGLLLLIYLWHWFCWDRRTCRFCKKTFKPRGLPDHMFGWARLHFATHPLCNKAIRDYLSRAGIKPRYRIPDVLPWARQRGPLAQPNGYAPPVDRIDKELGND